MNREQEVHHSKEREKKSKKKNRYRPTTESWATVSDSECRSDVSQDPVSSEKKRKNKKLNSFKNRISKYCTESSSSCGLVHNVKKRDEMTGEVTHHSRRKKGKKKKREKTSTDDISLHDKFKWSAVSDSECCSLKHHETRPKTLKSVKKIHRKKKKSVSNSLEDMTAYFSTKDRVKKKNKKREKTRTETRPKPLKSIPKICRKKRNSVSDSLEEMIGYFNSIHRVKKKKTEKIRTDDISHESKWLAVSDSNCHSLKDHETRPKSVPKICRKKRKSVSDSIEDITVCFNRGEKKKGKKTTTDEVSLHDESKWSSVSDSECHSLEDHETRPNPLKPVPKMCWKKKKSVENNFASQRPIPQVERNTTIISGSQEKITEHFVMHDTQILHEFMDRGTGKKKKSKNKIGQVSLQDKEENWHCDCEGEVLVANSGDREKAKKKEKKAKRHEVSEVSCIYQCNHLVVSDPENVPVDSTMTHQKLSNNGLRESKKKNIKRSLASGNEISSDEIDCFVNKPLQEESKEHGSTRDVTGVKKKENKKRKRNEKTDLLLSNESSCPLKFPSFLVDGGRICVGTLLTHAEESVTGQCPSVKSLSPPTDKINSNLLNDGIQREKWQKMRRKDTDKSSLNSEVLFLRNTSCESVENIKKFQNDSLSEHIKRNLFERETHVRNEVSHEIIEGVYVSDSERNSERINLKSSTLAVCRCSEKYKAADKSGEGRNKYMISKDVIPMASNNCRESNVSKDCPESSCSASAKDSMGGTVEDEKCFAVFDSAKDVEENILVYGGGNFRKSDKIISQDEKKMRCMRSSIIPPFKSINVADACKQVIQCERSGKSSSIASVTFPSKRELASARSSSDQDKTGDNSSKLSPMLQKSDALNLSLHNKNVKQSRKGDQVNSGVEKMEKEKEESFKQSSKRKRLRKYDREKEDSMTENKNSVHNLGNQSDIGIYGSSNETLDLVVSETCKTIDNCDSSSEEMDISVVDEDLEEIAPVLDEEFGLLDEAEETSESELVLIVEVQEKASPELIEKMKDLEIVLKHSVPPYHKIETKPTCSPSEKERKLLTPFCMKNYQFSEKEKEILKRNWRQFCQEYDFEDAGSFTTAFKYLTSENRIKFCQYLGQGLPKRTLHQIYCCFQNICVHLNGSRFAAEEDKLISLTLKSDCKNPFEVLSQFLRGPSCHVMRRYRVLAEHEENRHRDDSASPQLAEFIIKTLVKVLGCLFEDLKNRCIPASVWKKVGQELKIQPSLLDRLWRYTLHYRLFAEKNYSYPTIAKKIIEWLHSIQPESERYIRWGENTHIIPGSTGAFLCLKFQSIKKAFNATSFHSIRDFINYVYEERETLLLKLKNTVITRYHVDSDLSVSVLDKFPIFDDID